MLFNSNIFLFGFLPVFLLVFYLLPNNYRKYFLLLSGLFFYAWGAPAFLLILIASSVFDFYFSSLFNFKNSVKSKIIFLILIIINLILLLYYKYTGFFIDNVNIIYRRFFDGNLFPEIEIILPIGISFITFQKISYLVDSYRKPDIRGSFINYLNYIFFFPKLLSGPIQQWNNAQKQFDKAFELSINNSLSGVYRFCLGIFKKVWIANVIGAQTEILLNTGIANLSSLHVFLLVFAFSMQLLIDFSAYTDMACGIALMLGIILPENFNNPYSASSVRDFWQRWHISLTTWFRNYLFLPLAYRISSKLKKDKYLKIKTELIIYLLVVIITFILTGFWHGAAWNFILWGFYHGVLLTLDRFFLYRFFRKSGKVISVPVTFTLVLFGWLIFLTPDFNTFIEYLKKLSEFSFSKPEVKPLFLISLAVSAIAAFLPISKTIDTFMKKWFYAESSKSVLILKTIISIIFLILAMSGIASGGFSPFIYFRF